VFCFVCDDNFPVSFLDMSARGGVRGLRVVGVVVKEGRNVLFILLALKINSKIFHPEKVAALSDV